MLMHATAPKPLPTVTVIFFYWPGPGRSGALSNIWTSEIKEFKICHMINNKINLKRRLVFFFLSHLKVFS